MAVFPNATLIQKYSEERGWLCGVFPYCNTSGCDPTMYKSPAACPGCNAGVIALLFAILVLMALFTFFGNVGIIIVIIRNRIFHNPFNMFKCSLAVADLLVGMFVIPSGAFETLYIFVRPYDQEHARKVHFTIKEEAYRFDSLCHRMYEQEHGTAGYVLSVVSVLSIMASIFHLVLLSVDRFLAVRCPIKYNQGRALNNRLAAFLIFVVWFTCIILSAVVPTVMGKGYFLHGLTAAMIFNLLTVGSNTGFFYALFALALPFVLVVGLNLGTGILLFRKRTNIIKRTKNANNTNTNPRRSNEIKAAITLLVMVLTFTVSALPALVIVSLNNIRPSQAKTENVMGQAIENLVFTLLLISNSAWNFIIYSWRNENFRKALRKLICRTQKGKRRRFRWRKMKSAALRHSEKKRRRKKLAKQAGDSSYYDKKTKISCVSKNPPTPSISNTQNREFSSDLSRESPMVHPRLRQMASVTSSISGSSFSNNIGGSTTQTSVSEESQNQKSPAIVDGDKGVFFFGTKTMDQHTCLETTTENAQLNKNESNTSDVATQSEIGDKSGQQTHSDSISPSRQNDAYEEEYDEQGDEKQAHNSSSNAIVENGESGKKGSIKKGKAKQQENSDSKTKKETQDKVTRTDSSTSKELELPIAS